MRDEILSLIPKGRENALPMSHFIKITGYSRRDITDVIRELRKDYPICTTRIKPGGYWLGDLYDIKNTLTTLYHTKNTLENSIKFMENHLQIIEDVL